MFVIKGQSSIFIVDDEDGNLYLLPSGKVHTWSSDEKPRPQYYFDSQSHAEETLKKYLLSAKSNNDNYVVLVDGSPVYSSQERPQTVQIRCQRTVTVTLDDIL